MKIWIFSVVVHLMLLWALSVIIIPPAEKVPVSAVIQTYSYSSAVLVPIAIPEPQPAPESKTPKPVPPVKKLSSKKAKASKATAAASSVEITSESKGKSDPKQAETKPFVATGSSSLAQRALASAAAAASEPIVGRRQQREVVVRSSSAVDGELAPAMLKQVKTYADGSELVKGVHGCWKVPPTELRKGATWLMTSTPCETDTTVEQLNVILQKRRTYGND